MAWYDYMYTCKDQIEPTALPFGRLIFLPFKPKGYKDKFNALPKEKIEIMNRVDHVAGWTIIIGILTYLIARNRS